MKTATINVTGCALLNNQVTTHTKRETYAVSTQIFNKYMTIE
jgi:hypothetical protein